MPGLTAPLPVHGFVLAGGKSSRMGRDKALLPFRGRSMVEIAVEKLRSFCAEVSIAGNRSDLSSFAPVVREPWIEAGPVAGIGTGLGAASQPWALFLPVDVPILPDKLLKTWTEAVLARGESGCRLSYLRAAGQRHPAICLLHKNCLDTLAVALEEKVHKLAMVFDWVRLDLWEGAVWVADAEGFSPDGVPSPAQLAFWFSNVNTPQELAEAEAWSEVEGLGEADSLRE